MHCSFEDTSDCPLVNSDSTSEVWQLTDGSDVVRDNTLNLGTHFTSCIFTTYEAFLLMWKSVIVLHPPSGEKMLLSSRQILKEN